MNYILKVENLEKSYHNHKVLSNLNMKIEEGAIYGLVGRNGAGKTTLIRIITGLQAPTKGNYEIFDINYKNSKIKKHLRTIGAIIEKPALIENMTARENIIEQSKIVGTIQTIEIDALLKLVGLNDTDNKKVRNFSLGMRQRLGIAITLCSNPKFIILDEPINGLDPEGIIAIRKLILKLNKEQNITFLISSHYLDELSKIATNYGFIKNGKIIKEISSKEFNEKKQIKTELIVDVPKTAIKYFKSKNLQYKIIDNNTFELSNITNISNLILELSNLNCSVKNIKETEETLENYYLDLIGGKEND